MNHSQDPAAWPASHNEGRAVDSTPYGYGDASEWFDVEWAVSHRESPGVRRWRIALAGRIGFDVVHAWRNRRLLLAADAVWTHTEVEHLGVALVQRLHPLRRRVPVVAQSIWLWDHWDTFGATRRLIYGWLLRTHAVECLHSPLNVRLSRAIAPGRRVVLVPFGTNGLAGTQPDDPPTERWDVVAPGHDEHRDWATLADAAHLRPDLRFWVAAHPARTRGVTWPSNVTVRRLNDTAAYASLLANARVCVLALKPNNHASGMTTILEAASLGTPVVVAGDGGLRHIFGTGPRFVASGDSQGLAEAITDVLHGAGGFADANRRGLTRRDYVTRYALLTDMACGDRPWDAMASALAPQERAPAPGMAPGRRGISSCPRVHRRKHR